MTVEKRLSKLEKEFGEDQGETPLRPTFLFVRPKNDIPVTDEDIETECQEYEAKYGCRPAVVFICPVMKKEVRNDTKQAS